MGRREKCLRFHFMVRGKNFWVKPARRARRSKSEGSSKDSSESSNSILAGHSGICWDSLGPQVDPSKIDVSQKISLSLNHGKNPQDNDKIL